MTEKVINNFKTYIRQSAICGIPTGDAFIQFIVNDQITMYRLNDLKDWINTIADSKGNRNEKAYEAKRNLDQIFFTILAPFMKLKE